MKAHGVPWLIRHLRGEISLDEAAEGARMDTRRYAKRQITLVSQSDERLAFCRVRGCAKSPRKPDCRGLS